MTIGLDLKAAAEAGYPDDNPKTMYGENKLPVHLVPPTAVAALARCFAEGAVKYGPYNWRTARISSTVYYAAALRHLMAWYDGEDIDSDSGLPHIHKAMACLAMLADAQMIGKLNDNRPPVGAFGNVVEATREDRKPEAPARRRLPSTDEEYRNWELSPAETTAYIAELNRGYGKPT